MQMAHTLRVLKSAALVLFAAATLGAQVVRSNSWLRGQIDSDDPSLSRTDLRVELVNDDHSVIERAPASLGGDFELGNVPAGSYALRIVDRGGNVLREEYVQLNENGNFVNVRLPRQEQGERPISGQVSVSQLSHKAPRKAQKEFAKASEASRKQQVKAAIAHLEKAIQIDPAYMEAYNNLGAQYMYLNQFDKARDEFHKAYVLDHNSPPVAANLAIADLNLNRFSDAEIEARQALRLDATSNKARLLLGLALKSQERNLDEAVQNLEAGAREFPKGYLAAAELLAGHGDALRAAKDLERYLALDKVEHKEQVEAWLAQLQQSAQVASAPKAE